MKPVHRLLLAVAFVFYSIGLSAQQSPLHAYLPANATAIINFNFPSLASKMSWNDVQQLSFFEEAIRDAPPAMQQFLKDPASAGINFHSDLFIVFQDNSNNKAGSAGCLYGLVADTARFAAMVKQMAPKKKIRTIGKLKVLIDDKNIVAWTSEVFVVPLSKKDKAATPAGKSTGAKPAADQTKQLLEKCKRLLTPVANPITRDNRFLELAKENGDIRIWISRHNEKPKGAPAKKEAQILKMMNWGMMQEGNYTAGVLRFEKGKAVMQMKNYVNRSLDSLYRQYPPTQLNSNLLKKFPAGQPIVLFTFSMSPSMLGDILKMSGAQKIMDSVSQKSAVKPMEIMQGFNGDISLAIIQSKDYDEKDSITAGLNGLQIFLAASLKDKAKVQPLVEILQKPKEKKTDEEGNEIKPSGPFGNMQPTALANDSFLVLSISPFAAQKFLATAGDNAISRWAAPYAKNASLFALDLKAIIGFAMQMSKKKNNSKEDVTEMLKSFDKLVVYGGHYENGASTGTLELQFTDQEENSLRQFFKLVEMAMDMSKKSKKDPASGTDDPIQEDVQ